MNGKSEKFIYINNHDLTTIIINHDIVGAIYHGKGCEN